MNNDPPDAARVTTSAASALPGTPCLRCGDFLRAETLALEGLALCLSCVDPDGVEAAIGVPWGALSRTLKITGLTTAVVGLLSAAALVAVGSYSGLGRPELLVLGGVGLVSGAGLGLALHVGDFQGGGLREWREALGEAHRIRDLRPFQLVSFSTRTPGLLDWRPFVGHALLAETEHGFVVLGRTAREILPRSAFRSVASGQRFWSGILRSCVEIGLADGTSRSFTYLAASALESRALAERCAERIRARLARQSP